MLDLFGTGYILDHVISEHNNRMEQHIYRCYTSDLLQVIAETMGAEVHMRYADLVNGDTMDEPTADEIALDIIKRAGLKVK